MEPVAAEPHARVIRLVAVLWLAGMDHEQPQQQALIGTTFVGNFGDTSFGNVLPAGLAEAEVAADLTAVGSLEGGGDLGTWIQCIVPNPHHYCFY